MKDCSGKFILHKETFELFKDSINKNNLEALFYYINYRDENQ
jgi:hypothetical protein